MNNKTEIKTVSADLTIHVYVNCPHCDDFIDLLDESDTNGYNHNEEGDILRQTCPTNGNHWSDEHKTFSVDDVTCSKCKNDFNVSVLSW